MIQYDGIFQVVLFLLCWQCVSGQESDVSSESLLDQIALPTKISDEISQKPTKNPSVKKYSGEDRIESSTLYYENSNGFKPLISSAQKLEWKKDLTKFEKGSLRYNRTKPAYDENDDSDSDSTHEDLSDISSSHKNRRSYYNEESQEDFELLKVSNGTPTVASYASYHANPGINSGVHQDNTNSETTLQIKSRNRGKRIQNYLGNYHEDGENSGQPLRNQPEEKKNEYQHGESSNYHSHGTGYLTDQLAHTSNPNHLTYTSPRSVHKTEASTTQRSSPWRIKSPIVIQPNVYKTDKFGRDPVYITSSTPNPHERNRNQVNNSKVENVAFGKNVAVDGTNRNYVSPNPQDSSSEITGFTDDKEKTDSQTSNQGHSHLSQDSSRRSAKEHRTSYDNSYDDQGRKRNNLRSKSRYRPKYESSQANNDDEDYDIGSYTRNSENIHNRRQKPNKGNSWNQIGPNVEVSHSSGFEVGQIEKPKLHILPVNILSNFDHATALDNSQGFDISNAMISGFVPEGSFVTTSAPFISSSPSYFEQNSISSTAKPRMEISSIPDIIVGQSSFNNPVQAVVMPNSLQQNIFSQYMQSTGSPAIFAVTPSSGVSSSTMDSIFQPKSHQKQKSSKQGSHSNYNTALSGDANTSTEHESFKLHSIQPTTSRSSSIKSDSSNKKRFNGEGQYLASASFSVDHGNYAILHTGIGLINNQNPLLQSQLLLTNPQQNLDVLRSTNDALRNSMKQLQDSIQNQQYQLSGMSSLDNIGGSSSNVFQKAQLPVMGTRNVHIGNPNLNANTFAINQIPATIVTTPIPIFTTAGFISSKQGFSSTTPDSSVADRPLYNPINFVPNYDLVKSQSVLNTNVVPSDQFSQQNLNLIPLVPGGNFYKHSQGAQSDLVNKPKLSSDLEKYAEEMFKESLKTMYNSHKWNHDQFPANVSLVDNSEFARLRNELLRIKSTLRDTKPQKDVLEAHHTENKIRTVKPNHDSRRPDSAEQFYKQTYKSNSHHSHHNHPHHHRHKTEIIDFLTPPKADSYSSKSPFHDKPAKKRPSHGNRAKVNREKSRPRPRQGTVSKPIGLEPQASSIMDFRRPLRLSVVKNYNSHPEFYSSHYSNLPTFTTPSPKNKPFKASIEIKSSESDFLELNNQRSHNLAGLLMKNKQLPTGKNTYSELDTLGQFFDENKKNLQSQIADSVQLSPQKKFERPFLPIPLTRIIWLMVFILGHITQSFEQSIDSAIRSSNDSGGSLLIRSNVQSPLEFRRRREIYFSAGSLQDEGGPIFKTLNQDTSKVSKESSIPESIRITRSTSFGKFENHQKFASSKNFPSEYHSSFLKKQPSLAFDSSAAESQNILNRASASANGVPNGGVNLPYLGTFTPQPHTVVPELSNPPYIDTYINPKRDGSSTTSYPRGVGSNAPIYNVQDQNPLTVQKLGQIYNQVQFNPSGKNTHGHLQSTQVNPRSYSSSNYGNQQQLQVSPLSNFGSNSIISNQYGTIPTIETGSNGLTLPIIQLQTVSDFPSYMQQAASSPLLFDTETGLQYKLQPGFGASFDFAKPKIKKQKLVTNTAFQKPISALTTGYQAQIPHNNVQLSTFGGNDGPELINLGLSQFPDDYVEFSKQTQLHFDGAQNQDSDKKNKNIRQSKPFEHVRSEVEVFDKKKSPPPLSKMKSDESDESVSNDGKYYFNGDDSYFPKREDGEDNSFAKQFREPEPQTGFKPSKSYPFREYDEKFGDQTREHLIGDEDDGDDNRSRVVQFYNDQDDEEEDDASDDATAERGSKYQERPLRINYQDDASVEDESNESYKSSKIQNSQHKNRGPKASKNYKKRVRNSAEDDSWRKHSKTKREQSPAFKKSARSPAHHRRKESHTKSSKRRYRHIHQVNDREHQMPTRHFRKSVASQLTGGISKPEDSQESQVIWENSFRIQEPLTQKTRPGLSF
ncbi:hypothetical protein QAD02_008688 [Eretmocerus hayati]|uniref:Uncharacterized protein n=1 Tax=Eretmocerus hayati TaxID=131215 RepID=A0ACC2N7H0_9HYME|nr:hypothetical protein QAD02_008688 [Eretmocerus hayati]